MNLYQEILCISDHEFLIKRPKREIFDKRVMMAHIAYSDGMSVIHISIVMKCNRKTVYRYLKQFDNLIAYNKDFQTKFKEYI